MIILLAFLIACASLFSAEGITKAEEYKKNSGLQWTWAMDSLSNYPVKETDKILDVGCGDGKITAEIATKAGFVVGLDISHHMIDQATESFDLENLIFLQGDASEIPFKGQFDKAVSFCALHWIIDQEKVLSAIKRSLKPDGTALIVIPGKKPYNLGIVLAKVAQDENWKTFFPNFKQQRVYFSPGEFCNLIENVGMKVISLNFIDSTTKFADREALNHWVKPLVNCIDHLSSEQQQAFLNDVIDNMLSFEVVEEDGSIHLHDQKIEVIAQNDK